MRKGRQRKVLSMLLSVVMLTSLAMPAFAVSITAKYTNSKVLVDGKEIQFEAYNIYDNNYFKLRDIAKAISGTEKQFEVTWDGEANAVTLISGQPYTVTGGELATGDGVDKTADYGTDNILKDGAPANLTAYMVNDNNYFKLRDLGKAFDFLVFWDEENNSISIDTTKPYINEDILERAELQTMDESIISYNTLYSEIIKFDIMYSGRLFTYDNIFAENDIVCYENHPNIPNFGAMLNISPDKVEIEETEGSFRFATDKVSSENFYKCIMQLIANGFYFAPIKSNVMIGINRQGDSVFLMNDINSSFSFSVTYNSCSAEEANAAFAKLDAQREAQKNNAVGGVTYYSKYPYVPDMGAHIGLELSGEPYVSADACGYTYSFSTYSKEKLLLKYREYLDTLDAAGFLSYGRREGGGEIYSNRNGDVILLESSSTKALLRITIYNKPVNELVRKNTLTTAEYTKIIDPLMKTELETDTKPTDNNNVVYNEENPDIPNFGAVTNMSPNKVETKEFKNGVKAQIYTYTDSTNSVTTGEYSKLMKAEGFYSLSLGDDMIYINRQGDTIVVRKAENSFSVVVYIDKFISQEEAAATFAKLDALWEAQKNNAVDGIIYDKEYPHVPDMGTHLGLPMIGKEVDNMDVTYKFSLLDERAEEKLQKYLDVLKDAGFMIGDEGGIGFWFCVNQNGYSCTLKKIFNGEVLSITIHRKHFDDSAQLTQNSITEKEAQKFFPTLLKVLSETEI